MWITHLNTNGQRIQSIRNIRRRPELRRFDNSPTQKLECEALIECSHYDQFDGKELGEWPSAFEFF